MIKTLLSDLSYVLIFPKDKSYHDELNALYQKIGKQSDFVFADHFVINKYLFDYYASLKQTLKVVMFTSGTLQNATPLKTIVYDTFQKVYSASELGISKKSSQSYQLIAKELGDKPEEIVFIDDTKANVEAAQKAGFATILFHSNESLVKEIASLL